MRNKKLLIVAGTILLVSALLGSAAWAADNGTEGIYNYSGNTNGYVLEVTNTGSGTAIKGSAENFGANVGVYGITRGNTAFGLRGYSELAGTGVYGRNTTSGEGVYGYNDSDVGGYAGYFYGGATAVRGISDSDFGGNFSSYGASGTAIRAYTNGASSTGLTVEGAPYWGVLSDADWEGGTFNGSIAYAWGAYAGQSGGYGEGLYAEGTGYSDDAVWALTSGDYGNAINAEANGANAYAGYFISDGYRGIYADATTPMGWYDITAEDYANMAGTIFWDGTQGLLVRNDGAMLLQPGDVVVYTGRDETALGGKGAVTVAKAGTVEGVVMGVVRGAYILEGSSEVAGPELVASTHASARAVEVVAPRPAPEGELPITREARVETSGDPMASPSHQTTARAADPASGRFTGESAESGMYVEVATMGLMQVNVTATRPVAVGDWIVVRPDGAVTSVAARSYSTALDRGYTILGRAVEALDAGSGLVLVQINLR